LTEQGLAWLGLLLPGRIIITVHGLSALVLGRDMGGKMSPVLFFVLKYFNSRFRKIVTVSNTVKNELIEHFGIAGDKIEAIHDGVDQIFKPLLEREKMIEGLKRIGVEGEYYLHVGLGGLNEKKKNLRRLIEAYDLVRREKDPVRLVIAAPARDDDKETIERLLGSSALSDKIIFLSDISPKILNLLYNGAKALVFPSLYEGFGLPIIEAMACGCPVITSNMHAMKEVAEGAAILVNPYNTDEIADAMLNLLTDPVLRNELMQKGLKRASEFSLSKCVEKHRALYQLANK
jgi:glycosyltransferase involved in cell wall biosynthesis